MFRKGLAKVSSFLYKAHVYVNRQARKASAFNPYILHYNPAQSGPAIVHVNGNFIVGGTSQLIVDIIERTSDKYVHKIVVPDFSEPVPYQPVSIYKFSLLQMQKLHAFLEKEKPALVHIHYWVRQKDRYEWYALWYEAVFRICEELNLKVIQNVNVPTKPYISSSVVRNVFVSTYVMDNFSHGNNIESSVIYPGSDFSHFQNSAVQQLPANSIGMVYRLDTDKLNAEAIEVFISAVKKKRDIQCYIIGQGHYLKHYKKRVAEEGLEKNFIFTGMVSYKALPEYYKKFGIFVAPVHDESFGQVTPFAMSMGLCVAGYDTGALSEILGTRDTLVKYGEVEKLADVIVDLVNNPEERLRLGRVNQLRAPKHFSVKEMISRYKTLYNEYAG